jgi:hypothetical protein
MRRDTQVPLTDGGKDGHLCDGVGVKVVELHLIPGGKLPWEPTRWNSQPPLVERNEAQDIARGRVWHVEALLLRYPLWRSDIGDGAKETLLNELSSLSWVTEEWLQGSTGNAGAAMRLVAAG